MKFLALGSAIALIVGLTPAAFAFQSYKTAKDQVVVTGLQPQKKYEIKYKNAKGREGRRKVATNGCGEALLSKAATFQVLSIEGQQIQPAKLSLKEHARCKPAKKLKAPSVVKPNPSMELNAPQ